MFKKLRSEKGISAIILILAIAVAVMAAVVVYPYLSSLGDGTALSLDRDQESAAIQAGRLYWADELDAFTGIFDASTKTIVRVGHDGDTEKNHYSVAPYGMARKHQGMVILVSTDEMGDEFDVRWSKPADISDELVRMGVR